MRELIGILFLVALIIKFIWWILGALALVALFYIVRAIVRSERAAREARAKYCAEIASRAEQQHRWILQGDDRGIYGNYPIPDIVKAPLPAQGKNQGHGIKQCGHGEISEISP